MTTVRHLEDGDRERVAHMQRQAFLLPPERVEIAGRYPLEQGWVVEDGGAVHGALRVQKLGQFFGGRSVPCAAVSSVKVAAESRGGGYGGVLLREVLATLRSEGIAISTLFPVHLGVYRRFGWETAFACLRRRLPLGEAVIGPLDLSPNGYRVVPWNDDDLGDIAAFYGRVAARHNGPFDRSAEWWHERVLSPVNRREVYRYVARSAEGVGAYLVYSHEPAGANLPYGFEIDCRDFFWSDPSAAEAILAFVRGHAGMGHGFRWIGPVADPLELRLRVHDDVLPDNDGVIDVTFDGGTARVEPGAVDGALDVDVRTLAALFTGFLDPFTAADTGLLSGHDPSALHTLRAAFGGSPPWMAGFF